MTRDLLFEIGVEELPGGYVPPALEQLENAARDAFAGARLPLGDLWLQNEKEFSRYNFEEADVPAHFEMFKQWEKDAARLLDLGLVGPGYDCVIKCSHLFNILDARGGISVSERVGYIARVRKLARKAASAYLAQRQALGFPLLKDPAEREKWIPAPEAEPETAVAGTGETPAGSRKKKKS